jgi:Protein of unknown function (DUF3189).
MGIDEYDNDVYAIGAKSGRKIMMKAVRSFLKESGIGENEILLIDTLPAIGLLTKLGGMTSRRFKIISVGRPFTVYGIIKKYNNFLDIVNKVKSRLKELD